MNDIYYEKAKKYKYKYLKLKREYIAKGGVWGLTKLSSCIATPPVLFSQKSLNELQIKRDYPMTSTSDSKSLINEFYDINHIGRLLSYNDYEKELANFKSLNPPPNFFFNPIMEQYIRIKYACLIFKEKRVVPEQLQIVSGTYKAMILPDNHLKQTFPKCSVIGPANSYGYIISNTSKSFSQLCLNSQFSKPINDSFKIQHATILLNRLIEAIKNFLIPLHNQGYVLDYDWDKTINWKTRSYLDEQDYYENIYWDEKNYKIYFNILKMKKDNLKQYIYKDIKGLIYYIYKFYTLILRNLKLNLNLNHLINKLDDYLINNTNVTSEELIIEIRIIIDSLKTTIQNSQDEKMLYYLKMFK
jgi:hypothetical protein